MIGYQDRAGLQVAQPLIDFVEREALPDTGIEARAFWAGVETILRDLAPKNADLLAERDRIQSAIDDYHRSHPGPPAEAEYRAFLTDLGYLVPPSETGHIATTGVDPEITDQAGPQLVVPLLNARFAVNAANARWVSLYDALYGTDAIPESGDLARGPAYNPVRGGAVIAFGRAFLDEAVPLAAGSHDDAVAYRVIDGRLRVELGSGQITELRDVSVFAGYAGDPVAPASILLVHNHLHLDVIIDREGTIGSQDAAGVQDIVVEAAVTTIMDLEDSVAAVDAEDKALGYHNWRELMRGTLCETVTKQGRTFLRTMNPDRLYTAPGGERLSVRGRSLLFVRNVGHLMTTDAVLIDGREAPEGILDAIMTTLGAMPDLRGAERGTNSATGSVYIVKPKMHGPDEVAFTAAIFGRVEELLGLPAATVKVGIMDEERRTTLNLDAAIAAAPDRVVFVNTGFLDRTGDEIHTSLLAGPVVPKARIKGQPFLAAYEARNVDVALRAGFGGSAQIGKGMWAMPDLMHDMLEQKVGHVRSGATTAWVPSPTAAALHALHYHRVDAFAVQREKAKGPRVPIDDILTPPLAREPITDAERLAELDNNVQSILGYVVRWIDQGIGCSKVPDIHGVGLMEDRATLRISSQLLANWLMHGVITEPEVDDSLRRLSAVVDEQNSTDPNYELLSTSDGPGLAFQAARELIIGGARQPNGYTEPILHRIRREKKAEQAGVLDRDASVRG